MIIKLRPRIEGKHIKETVFIGEEEESLQNAGEITFSHIGEWQVFGAALLLGADQMKGHLKVISEGNAANYGFMKELAELSALESEN